MAKGGDYERAFCKELSTWWTLGDRNDVFWRSASSGAMATQRAKTGGTAFNHYGDVTASDPIGQPLLNVFSIELKKGYDPNGYWNYLTSLVTKVPKEWEQMMGQAYEGALAAGAISPLLVHKADRKEAMCYFEYKVCKELLKRRAYGDGRIKPPFIRCKARIRPYRSFPGICADLAIMQWKTFMEIDPDIVRHYANDNIQ